MTWETAIVGSMFGITCLFFWLSKSYDNEHSVLKVFFQLFGFLGILSTTLLTAFTIPIGEASLAAFFNTIIIVIVFLTVLMLIYWFFYMWGKGMLEQLKAIMKGVQQQSRVRVKR